MTVETITLLGMISVFTLILGVCLVIDSVKRAKSGKGMQKSLFTDYGKRIYYVFTGVRPEKVAKKMGIDAETYVRATNLLGIPNQLEQVIVEKILGLIILVAFSFFGVFTSSVLLPVVACIVGCSLIYVPGRKEIAEARKQRDQLLHELPRFMDLLQTALYIHLPVEEAIRETTKHLDNTLLATEFDKAMADVKIGAYDWETALERVAKQYDVDDFSDFVQDLTIAQEMGLDIYTMVRAKNKTLKQTNLFRMREKATKLNNMILLPISVFEMVPLLAIMFIPIIFQLQATGVM